MNLSKKLAKLVEFTLKKKFLKNPNLLFCVCVCGENDKIILLKKENIALTLLSLFDSKFSEIPKSSGAMKKTQVT